MRHINFYRSKVAINVLARDVVNVREIYDTAEGHTMTDILSAQFPSVEEGALKVKRRMNDVPSIFVGLGVGNPAQYYKAAMVASQVYSAYVNQTFTGRGLTVGALAATGGKQTHINALASPTSMPGDVLILTGANSSQGTSARVSCDAAVRMMLDLGAHAVEFLPMGGKQPLPELHALTTTAA